MKEIQKQQDINKVEGEDTSNLEYYKLDGTPVLLPLRSEKEIVGKKGVNYMNYAILVYLSKYQDIHEVGGFDGYDTDRYIYEGQILKNRDMVTKYSKNKMSTFIRNARKLAKATNDDFVIVETNKRGEIIYRLGKNNGKYVLIERRMLEVLIKCTNSDMLKAYVFFKWRLRNGGGIISRKELADYLGYCVNNNRKLHDLSKDIETTLVKLGLIRKELITVPSYDCDKDYNSSCYYELVPYCEWIEFWNNGQNAVEFKEKL